MGRSRPPLVCLKKYTFSYTGERVEKALKKICVLGLTTKFIQCILKAQNKFSALHLENLIPAHFSRTAGEIRISAYQGRKEKAERNI